MAKIGKSDNRTRVMSALEIERAAWSDPDAQPLTSANLRGLKRAPQVKVIRRALELTQEEFAARYHIPIGTLRDCEQGRSEPDQSTRSCLMLIALDAERVGRVVNSRSR